LTLPTLHLLNPLNYFKKFKKFDKVTELRLINAFIVAIGIALLTPILVSLKGIYLAAWVISLFTIAQTLAVKTNKWVVSHVTIEQMFKLSIIIHLLFITISAIYFISPLYMVIADSILGIVEVSLFTAFSISLNNYITDKHPDEMSNFQIVRNGSWADGFLFGLLVVTIITYFSTIGVAIGVFIVFNLIFSLWLITKWNFYTNEEYCTTLHINTKK